MEQNICLLLHFVVRCEASSVRGLSRASPREQAPRDTLAQLAGFLGKSAVSCLLAFSNSKSDFYGFWISSWDINGRGESNNDASKNKSLGSLETPQNSTHWEEAFLKALESIPFISAECQWKMKSLPSWPPKASPATSHLGPNLPGASWSLCKVRWWRASKRQEKGKRG